MSVLDLSKLKKGDRVQHPLMVQARDERATKDGKPFSTLTLGNRSGSLDVAPIWQEKLDWVEGAVPGKLVQVLGTVSTYKDKRQLELTGPLRVLPMDGMEPGDFVPAISEEPAKLWEWIDKERAGMKSRALRAVVDLFYADDDFRVRFERCPAAPRGHHALVGGLLLHVVEVARIGKGIAHVMGAHQELVVAGALLHDIGKVESYAIEPGGFTVTPAGYLLGHIVLGSLMLERKLLSLPTGTLTDAQALELHHFIQSHHGIAEYGAAVPPMTVEAEILHWADESSAKASSMAEVIGSDEHFGGGAFSLRKPFPVDKRVWRRPHGW
ncbi:MAG: HD domain-containing protein [Gemmatimonadetes bacterium]|nr:HD domain-containing protein [Gemmatimonadota bacterium]